MGNPFCDLSELNWSKPPKIFTYFKLIWPFCDLAMTLSWPYDPCQAQPQPCHHLGCDSSHVLWFITCIYLKYWPLVQTWQSLSYLVSFCHMRKGWHKGDLMGYYPSSPYINAVTSGGVCYISMLGSSIGEFQPPLTSQVSWIEAKPTKIGYLHLFEAD